MQMHNKQGIENKLTNKRFKEIHNPFVNHYQSQQMPKILQCSLSVIHVL